VAPATTQERGRNVAVTDHLNRQHAAGLQAPTKFLEIFRSLVVVFKPKGLERDAAIGYWRALGTQFTIATLREAAARLIRSHPFFPTAAEWSAVTDQVLHDRIMEGQHEQESEPCEWCGDKGLVRINYVSDEPFDIAICSCVESRFCRTVGPNAVRLLLKLDDCHRVGLLEDFDDELDGELTAHAERPRGVFVYALQVGEHLKIGFSTNLERRRQTLCAKRGRDGQFVGHACVKSSSIARLLERRLQHRFGTARLDGEWFRAEPDIVRALRDLLRDPAAVEREIAAALANQQQLQPRPAQQNIRVIQAVAMDVLKAAPVEVPAEYLIDELLDRCKELRIECDEDAVRRSLRGAAFVLKRAFS
jgi:hypothetical protein